MPEGVETPTPPAVPGKGKTGGLAEEIKRIPIWVWFVIAVVFFVVYKTYFANSAVGNASTDTTGATDNSLASAGDTSTTGDTVSADSGAGISTASTTGPDTTSSSSSSGGPKTEPANPPPSGKSGGSKTVYTIQPGDTLSGIGARFNVPWEQVYQANESVIEQTAQQRSGHSSNGGMWIYPGEKLVIP